MANYYVSSSGSDSNSGTSAGSPWLTIGKVNSGSYNPGDTINFNGGNTFNDATLAISSSNYSQSGVSATNLLTIQSYGTGQATITGTTTDKGITITNVSGVTVTNLTLAQPTTTVGNAEAGNVTITTNTTSSTQYTNISVTNCTFTGGTCGVGVYGAPTTSDGITGLTISGNTFTGQCNIPILVEADTTRASTRTTNFPNPVITGNICHNFGNATITSGDDYVLGIFINNASGVAGQNRVGDVYGNYLYNFAAGDAQSGGGPAGVIFSNCANLIMEDNVVYSMSYGATDDDAPALDLDLGCSSCTMRYNLAYNCQGEGIEVFGTSSGTNSNSTVCFNAVINCGLNQTNSGMFTGAVIINGKVTGCNFFNNDIWNTGAVLPGGNGSSSLEVVYNDGNGPTIGIYNNIIASYFLEYSVNIQANTTATLNGNLYLQGGGTFGIDWKGTVYTSLSSFNAATSQEANGVVANPLLSNPPSFAITSPTPVSSLVGYKPVSGSPAISAGLNLNSLYSITMPPYDMGGNSLPSSGYNIGAFNETVAAPTGLSPYDVMVLNLNPVNYWPMNETSGTVMTDYSISGTNGTYHLATVNTSMPSAGASKGVQFSGSGGSYAGGVDQSYIGQAYLTAMAWVNGASVSTIIGKWTGSAPSQNFLCYVSGTEIYGVIYGTNGKYLAFNTSGANIQANTTYFVVMSWNSVNGATVYVNGVSQTLTFTLTQSPNTLPAGTTFDLEIGADSGGSTRNSNAIINRAAFFQSGPTQAVVTSLYNQGITPPPVMFPFFPQVQDDIVNYEVVGY